MRKLIIVALLATGALLLPVGASAERLAGSGHGGAPFTATLTPSVSDSTGSGNVLLTINPGQEEVCWHIQFSGLTSPVTASHIHRGPAGTNGPVVVPFFNFATPRRRPSSAAAPATMRSISQHRSETYCKR